MNSGVQSKNPYDRSHSGEASSLNHLEYEPLGAWKGRTTPSIPQLVGAVYCAAPPGVRVKILEHLIRPLGVLSLAAVAQGVFARIRFRSGWPDLKIRADDVVGVQMADVISLVEHVLQVDERVVAELDGQLQAWPSLREHEAAATLIQLLRQGLRDHDYSEANGGEPVWH